MWWGGRIGKACSLPDAGAAEPHHPRRGLHVEACAKHESKTIALFSFQRLQRRAGTSKIARPGSDHRAGGGRYVAR